MNAVAGRVPSPSNRLRVISLSGEQLCEVYFHSEDTVMQLKVTIERTVGIAPLQQRLVANDRVLLDCELVSLPDAEPYVWVTLLLRSELQVEWLQRIHDATGMDSMLLRDAPPLICDDREVFLAAVSKRGIALEFASDAVRSDKEVVLAAVENEGLALEFASEDLRMDIEAVFAAVRDNGLALEYVSADMRMDLSLVLAAVQNDGLALELAAEVMQGDRDVVLAAVAENGLALQFAAEDLRVDGLVALTAVAENGLALEFAAEVMRGDLDVVRVAVQNDARALRFATEAMRGRGDVAFAASKSGDVWLLPPEVIGVAYSKFLAAILQHEEGIPQSSKFAQMHAVQWDVNSDEECTGTWVSL